MYTLGKRKNLIALAAMACLILVLGTCDLFKVGFGSKVDIKDPAAEVTNLENGAYVKGDFTLSGTSSDDVGVTAVSVKTGTGDYLPATLNSDGTWSITIHGGSLADGETNFLVKAADASGKSSEKKLFLYIDNTPPVVLVKNPSFNGKTWASMNASEQSAANSYNQQVSITGGAADNQRLKSVTLTVYALDGSVVSTKTIAGQLDWSFTFTPPTSEGASLTDYVFCATALDYAGNVSDHYYTSADLRPSLGSASVPPADDLVLIEEGQSVSGVPLDKSGLLALARPATSASGRYVLIDPNSDNPTFVLSNPAETGDYHTNVLSSLSHVVGMVTDDDGVDTGSIEVRVRSYDTAQDPYNPWGTDLTSDWVPVTAHFGSGLTVRFDYDLHSSSLAQGNYVVQVRAKDVNGLLARSNRTTFRVEAAASTISIQSHTSGQYVPGGAALTIYGSASDPDNIASVDVLFDVGGQVYEPATLSAPGAGNSDWTITSALDASSLAWATSGTGQEGTYNVSEIPVIVRVTDGTGQASKANVILLLDNEQPAITFDSPDLFKSQNGTVIIQGTSSDNVTVTATTATVNGSPLSLVSGTNIRAWKYQIDTTALTSTTGSFPIVVTTTDGAGNTRIGNYTLLVDQSSDLPAVSFTGLNSSITTPAAVNKDNNLLGYGQKLYAKITDDDAVDPTSIRLRFDGGSWQTLGVDAGFTATSTSTIQVDTVYEIANSSGPTNYLAPGMHFVEYRFADNASAKLGQPAATVTTSPIYFAVDRDSPEIALDQSGVPLVNAAPVLSGRATDSNGIKSVQISDDGGTTWSASRVNTVSVTANAAANTFTTASAHNLQAGDAVVFGAGTMPSGLAAATRYYVIPTGLTATQFEVSATSGGSAVDFTTAGASVTYTGPRWQSLPADINVSSGLDANGRKTILVRATDIYDKSTDKTITIQVDTTPPSVQDVQVKNESGNTFSPLAGAWTVNGTVTLRGSVVEDNGLQFTRFAIVNHGAGLPADSAFLAANGGFEMDSSTLFAWNFSINTTLAAYNNKSLDVYIWSRDTAGNDAKQLVSANYLIVNQESDRPVITVLSPTGTNPTDRLLESNPTITVKVDDDDGLDVSTIQIAVAPYSATTDPSSFVPFDVNPGADNDLGVTVKQRTSLDALPDGRYEMIIRATDRYAGTYSTGTSPVIDFYIDRANPTLDVSAPATMAYFNGGSIALSGTEYDANGLMAATGLRYRLVKSLSLTANAGTDLFTAPVAHGLAAGDAVVFSASTLPTGLSAGQTYYVRAANLTATAFEVSATSGGARLDITSAGSGLSYKNDPAWTNLSQAASWSGSYAIRASQADDSMDDTLCVLATDIFGKQTEKDVPIHVDTQAPTALITTPASAGTWQKGLYAISGQAADATSGVDKVEISVDTGTASWQPASLSGLFWSYQFDSTSFNDDRTIRVRTTDKAGLVSGTVTQTVRFDNQAPALSGLMFNGSAYSQGSTAYANAAATLSGSASDNRSLSDVTVEVSVDGGTTYAAPVAAGGTPAAWTYATAGTQGSYTYRVIAHDSAGNASSSALYTVVIDTNAPAVPSITAPDGTRQPGDSVATQATSTDNGPAGIEALYTYVGTYGAAAPALPANLGSWTQNSLSGTNWVSSLTLGTEGRKTLHFVARDKAGNLSGESTVSFWADKNPPVVAIAAPTSGSMVNLSGFTLRATASDPDNNGIASVIARIGNSTWADSANNKTLAWNAGNSDYEYVFTPADLASLSGSQYLYVRATDNAGQYSDQNVNLQIDTTPPTVKLLSPASGGMTNSTIQLSGTSSDDQGVDYVSLYLVKPLATTVLASSDTFTTASAHGLSAGDVVSFTGTVPSGVTAGTAYYVLTVPSSTTFTVSATSGGATLNVTADGSGFTVLGVTATLSANAGTYYWSMASFDTSAYGNATYGTLVSGTEYSMTLRAIATDKAGNRTPFSPAHPEYTDLPFHIDQNSDIPTITLFDISANPASPTTLLGRTIRGTLSDDDGTIPAASMRISLDGSTWTTGATSQDSDPATNDLVVNGSNWKFVMGSGVADGANKTLYLQVTDAKGTPFSGTLRVNDDLGYATYRNPPITFSVDTVKPDLAQDVYVDTSPASWDAPTLLTSGMAFGGSATGTFLARVNAGDANGVFSVRIAITGVNRVGGAPLTVEVPATLVTGQTYPSLSTYQTSTAIDVTGFVDNNLSMIVTVQDNSGLETTLTKNITVDNTAPGRKLSETSVTANAGTDTFTTASAHGLAAGDVLYFTGTLPGNLVSGVGYYVRTVPTSTTFTLSSTSGGSLLDITSAGSGVRYKNDYGISFTSPASNAIVYGDVSVNGMTIDNLSGLSDISYKHGWNSDTESWTSLGSSMSWTLPFTGTAKIDTFAGKAVTANNGTSTFSATAHGFTNGQRVYFGADTLPAGISAAGTYYVVNASANSFQASTTYPAVTLATFTTNGTNVKASVESSDTNNDGIWDFPLLIRATDAAGNTTTSSSYGLRINPDGDKPLVDIGYPTDDPSGSTPVGGTVRVQGTAQDNELVYAVYMQIDVNGDGVYNSSDSSYGGITKDWYNGGYGQQVSGTNNWYANINDDGKLNPTGADPRMVHIRVRAQDSKNNGGSGDVYGAWEEITVWFDNDVPQYGSSMPMMLDPDPSMVAGPTNVTANATTDTFTTSAAHGLSVGNVVYFASESLPGGIASATGYFVRTVPTSTTFTVSATSGGATLDVTSAGSSVSFVAVDGDEIIYSPGMYINRTLYLRGSVEDSGTIDSVTLSGSVSGSLSGNPTWFVGASGSRRVYFSVPLTVASNSSTVLNFSSTALDRSTPQRSSLYTFRIGEDSIAPTTTLTTDTTIVQSASNVKVAGVADDGESGVDYVEAYFIRRGNGTTTFDRFYNPSAYHDSALLSTGNAPITVTSGSTYDYPSSAAYRVIINREDDLSAAGLVDANNDHYFDGDLDMDGYLEKLKASTGTTYEWSADINSSIRASNPGVFGIPDGPIEVHYIVHDKAGNTSHYVQASSSIQNNGPLVGAIWLGTDLDNSGSIADSERIKYLTPGALTYTNFKVKNDSMDFYVEATQGNGDLYYTLAETSGSGFSIGSAGSPLKVRTSGTLGYITLNATQLNSIGDRTATFQITLWDSTEETTAYTNSLHVTRSITCKIKRADTRSPVTVVNPLYWNSSSDNSLYQASSANGHIEVNGVPGDTADPKVSGQISIRGTTTDNKKVSEIWMHIDNFAFPGSTYAFSGYPTPISKTIGSGGTYYRVATYNLSATLGTGDKRENGFIVRDTYSTNGWKFTVLSSTFSQNSHVVTWQLDWNSALISGVAVNNQTLSVVAEDKLATENGAAVNQSSQAAASSTISGTATRPDATHLVDAANLTNIATLWDGLAITVGTTNTTVVDYTPASGILELADSVDTASTSYSLTLPTNTPSDVYDVVPYIANISTTLSNAYGSVPSTLNRSAKGWYPVQNGEQVTVNGFNLNGASTVVTVNGVPQVVTATVTPLTSVLVTIGANYSVTANSTTNTFTTTLAHGMEANMPVAFAATTMPTGLSSGTIYYVVGSSLTNNTFQVSLTSGGAAIDFNSNGTGVTLSTMSGDLTAVVGNTRSLNNGNSNGLASNLEPNGVNNNILTDDRKVRLWQFNTVVSNTGVRFPTMRVGGDTSQTVGFIYDSGAQYVRMNVAGSDFQIDQSYTQWYDTAMAVDGNGYPYGFSMNGDSGGTGSQDGSSGTGHANGEFYAWNTSAATGSNSTGNNAAYSNGSKKVAIENSYTSAPITAFDSTRILEPRIATGATNGNVYMSYYDNINSQTRYRYGTVTGTYPTPTFGGNLVNHANAASGSGTGFHVVADGTTTFRSGKYSAVGVSPDGSRAYVAWYDANARRLVFSWNNSPTTASAAQWQTNAKYIDGAFTGWYVDMAVDAADHIHLAYYNSSTGDLKYAYLDTYLATPVVVTVDSWLSVGSNISITTKYDGTNYVPYISYYMSSYDQTQFCTRVAYRTNFTTPATPTAGASADLYTGDWEVQTLPCPNIPKNFRVGIGIKSVTGGATNSPIVGFASDIGLETAQLK